MQYKQGSKKYQTTIQGHPEIAVCIEIRIVRVTNIIFEILNRTFQDRPELFNGVRCKSNEDETEDTKCAYLKQTKTSL